MTLVGLFIIIYILIGIVAGFIAGFFGIGGGVIFVPILITTLPYFGSGGHLFHVVLGTSLALIIPSGISATIKHIQQKDLDYSILANWCVFVFFGAADAVFIVNIIPSYILQIIFALFMIFIFIYAFIKRSVEDKGDDYLPSLFVRIPGAFFVGLISIFFGLGGGVPTTILLQPLGYPIKKSISLSSCAQIVIGVVGAVGLMCLGLAAKDLPRFSFGYINWFALACLGPMTFIFAPLGVALANKVNDKLLKRLYIILIFCIMVYVIIKTAWHFF